MPYELITNRNSPNFTNRLRPVRGITIHWWGAGNPTFDGVVNYLCRPKGNTSAHDVIEAGRVACIVDPDKVAWHSGNNTGNNETIGLELNPRASDGDYLTAAERIADYRKTYGDLYLKRHRDWKATACPGVYDIARLDRMAREIQAGITQVSNPVVVVPAPAPAKSWVVIQEGVPAPAFPLPAGWYFGPKSGPEYSVSGYFSYRGQLQAWQQRMKDRGWDISPDGLYGPQTASITEAFQREKGLEVDRKIGPQTWAAAWTTPITRWQ